MKLRNFLKLIAASPLVGLFKKKESTHEEGLKALADLCQPVLSPPEEKWFTLKLRKGHPLKGNKEVEEYLAEATDYMHEQFDLKEIMENPYLRPVDTEIIEII